MSETPRVAGIVMLRDDGAALLQHRDDKPGLNHAGLWVPPGGHAEPGEPIEACARREFLEETELACGALHVLDVLTVDATEGDMALTMFWTAYDGYSRPVCHEGQALGFVGLDELDSHPMPAYLVDLWKTAIDARDELRGW